MNQELKAKWLKALKSGKYTQGQGALNRNGTMCCLGVLCDIIDSSKWVPVPNSDDNKHFGYMDAIHTGYIPANLADGTGLGDHDVRLAVVNDHGNPDNYATVIEYIKKNL